MALTGLWWSYGWYRATLESWADRPEAVAVAADAPAGPLDVQVAWEAFEQVAPAWSEATINFPRDGGAVTFRYLDADPTHERARNQLSLDPATLAVVAHERYDEGTFAQRLVGGIFALHRGSWFGPVGTWVFMLASAVGGNGTRCSDLADPDHQRLAPAVQRMTAPAVGRRQQRGVARGQRRQGGRRAEGRVPREQIYDPCVAGVDEQHHRPHERAAPEPCLDQAALPHQVEVGGRSVDELACQRALAGKAQAVVRRQQLDRLAIVEAQAQAVSREQHEFAIDTRKRGERRIRIDLGDRQAPSPCARAVAVACREDLAGPTGSVAPAFAPMQRGGDDLCFDSCHPNTPSGPDHESRRAKENIVRLAGGAPAGRRRASLPGSSRADIRSAHARHALPAETR